MPGLHHCNTSDMKYMFSIRVDDKKLCIQTGNGAPSSKVFKIQSPSKPTPLLGVVLL